MHARSVRADLPPQATRFLTDRLVHARHQDARRNVGLRKTLRLLAVPKENSPGQSRQLSRLQRVGGASNSISVNQFNSGTRTDRSSVDGRFLGDGNSRIHRPTGIVIAAAELVVAGLLAVPTGRSGGGDLDCHDLTPRPPLPCLPWWSTERFAVPLDLESSYEQTCRDRRRCCRCASMADSSPSVRSRRLAVELGCSPRSSCRI